MNTTDMAKGAGALLALAMCSACALRPAQDDMAVAPSTAELNVANIGRTVFVNGRPVTAEHPNLGGPSSYATFVPDRLEKSKKYEYIINDYSTYASIFDYPKSDEQIGTINDVGGQGCSNVLYGYGKKIIWIVAGWDQISEYAVPQTLLKTLSLKTDIGEPSSCGMNASGDLAVGILNGSGGGDIVIFKNASGSGKVITTPLHREYFDGYDNRGNLFFDGLTASYRFELLEIPRGSRKPEGIRTSNKVRFPGSVQWDGKYLVVTDQETNDMYQYTVSGTKATLQGTVVLSGATDCAQTWIATDVVYCADAGAYNGKVYEYPAGGSPIATFTGNFDLPLGTVAAEK